MNIMFLIELHKYKNIDVNISQTEIKILGKVGTECKMYTKFKKIPLKIVNFFFI